MRLPPDRTCLRLVPPLFALVMVAGCRHSADPPPLPLEPSASFSASGQEAMAGDWWTAFEDPRLDELIREALGNNLDLRVTWARFAEAQAIAARVGAGRWPLLEAAGLAATRDPAPMDGDQLQLTLAAEYELDLWGRIRSASEAEALRATASGADYQTAAVTLAAEVAGTWFELVTIHNQHALLADQIEANERQLESLGNRFASGQSRRADLLRQEQLLELTREQLHRAQARRQVTANRLAALLGQAPGVPFDSLPRQLPGLPALPATGLPAELLNRRPDLRAAHARLMAADLDVATAVSERFPRITLGASIATEGNDATDLFDDWIRRLAGSIVAPLFDGGSRRAEVRRAEAVRQRLLYDYGSSLLNAVREVEDALVLESRQARQMESLLRQLRLAEAAEEQLRREYANGMGDYIDLLTASIDAQQLRRDFLEADLLLHAYRLALYRALAGPVPGDHLNPDNPARP
jgi:NodT family efflux transporter outer membrane factor (OMF) lipoprotein